MKRWFMVLCVSVAVANVGTACTKQPAQLRAAGDGLDPTSVPEDYRADYALFAQRCSKCHSLSRALDNGHVEDRFWQLYVERMRRQPGSGIAPEDVPSILRFLHFYSAEVAQANMPATPTAAVDGGAQ